MTEERWVGQTLAGKYRVERVLGKGGMGLVVEARHIKLDEPVAIKLLRPAMMEVDGMVARFVREARAASKIKSEHSTGSKPAPAGSAGVLGKKPKPDPKPEPPVDPFGRTAALSRRGARFAQGLSPACPRRPSVA